MLLLIEVYFLLELAVSIGHAELKDLTENDAILLPTESINSKLTFIAMRIWGLNHNVVCKALVLHVTYPDSIPNIINGPTGPTRI